MDASTTKSGYFAQASTTAPTPGSSAASTPTEEVKVDAKGLEQVTQHPLPPLMRDFPRPVGEVDVEKALQRGPGRWTFVGQMEANRVRNQLQAAARRDGDSGASKREFDAVKADLLQSYQKMRG